MKITNIRVGKEFNELLSKHPLFAGDDYKLISPCHYFLDTINEIAVSHARNFVSFHSRRIKAIFRNHNKRYREYLTALEDIGLVEIKHCYRNFKEKPESNRTNEYRVTELGMKLLRDSATEYLRKLHDDPQIKRIHQKNRSKRRRAVTKTGDLVVDSTFKTLHSLKYDHKLAETIMNDPEFSRGARDSMRYSIIRFEDGTFGELERNPIDGRLHHSWVQMKSQLRPAFNLEGLVLVRVIDIRACHPTFWASYVVDHWYQVVTDKEPAENTLIPNTIRSGRWYPDGSARFYHPINPLPHYVGVDGDILIEERNRWIDCWTNIYSDPRDAIAQQLGMKASRVKQLINSALNGSRNRIFEWIAVQYPTLFKLWSCTNLKRTGNEISKLYESAIMLNEDFYSVVERLGLRVISEHDGLSVFASPDEAQLDQKIDSIVNFLQDFSRSSFDVPIVLKVKSPCSLN